MHFAFVYCFTCVLNNKKFIFQVFSAFGFVHKIATFEKASGYQVVDIYFYSFCNMLSLVMLFSL
jgi:hypothetical protein